MLYDLYPGLLFTLQYKGYRMVGMELTIANKNSECGSMPQYAITCLYVIIPNLPILSCHPVLPV